MAGPHEVIQAKRIKSFYKGVYGFEERAAHPF
jgi:hypothetical protein